MLPLMLHTRWPRSRIKITKAISSYESPHKPKYIGRRRLSAKYMFWLANEFEAKSQSTSRPSAVDDLTRHNRAAELDK